MKRVLSLAAIGVGGVLGAAVRWAVNEALPDSVFPWSTFVVNVIGCGLLARVAWSAIREDLKAAGGVGFCGGLTTFSTFAVETVHLGDDGRIVLAVVYVAASVVVGLGAYMGLRRSTIASKTTT